MDAFRIDADLIHGFISYSHDDHWAFEKMRVHIKGIERALVGKVDFWADTRIRAGDYWSAQIERAIDDAKLHLLLISAEFLASDYIALHELTAVNAKYALGDLVVPVILKGCIWEPFVGPLQAVPILNGRVRPIFDWSPRDDGFGAAARQILHAVEGHFGLTADAGLDWRRA